MESARILKDIAVCGIFGIIDLRLPDLEHLIRATHLLRHRGPDDWGVVALLPNKAQGVLSPGLKNARVQVKTSSLPHSVVLGHRRLSIIDLTKAGRQPMADPQTGNWLTYNGEIYNFQEIRQDLEAQGLTFSSKTDTEVLLLAYRVWGKAAVNRLRGMFAFGLWDSSQEQLLLARDRIGKKPIFYYHDTQCFAFASELKALLALPQIEQQINLAALHDYLTFGYVPGEQTIFRKIKKVPPGYFLIWKNGDLSLEQYWDVKHGFPVSGSYVMSERDWIQDTKKRLADCVQARLVSDVPIGAFLSGGLDSSAIVGLMSKMMGKGVRTFSIGFRENSFDELRYARIIAEQFETEHHEFIVEPNAADLLSDLVWYLDEPFADASVLPTYLLAQLASSHVKVVLTGDGGDESFAGYESYLGEQYSHLYGKIPWPLRSVLEAVFSKAPESSKRNAVLRRAKRFLEKAELPLEYREWRLIFPHAAKQALYSDDLKASIGTQNSLECRARAFEANQLFDWVVQLQLWDFQTYLPDDLMVKTDRATMANGLEARAPFLDHHLIEWSAGLPSDFKVRGWNTKYILKESLKSLLPAKILQRPKQGFSVPVSAWFRGELREMSEDLLLSLNSSNRGYFRRDQVEALLRAHVRGEADHGHKLWSLVNLELWHQNFSGNAKRGLSMLNQHGNVCD